MSHTQSAKFTVQQFTTFYIMSQQTDTKQTQLVALCTIMLCLAIIAVALRFLSNHVSPKHRFGYDDVFALLALIDLGLGRHAATVPEEHLLKGPKIIFIAAFLYDAAICLPKFSALFFYHRIFGNTSRPLVYCLWTVGTLNAMWLISAWLTTIFECIPVHALWDPVARERGARCFDQWRWFLGTAISSMIIDLMILIMPLPFLWNLQASWKRRATVSVIFICGYCVVVVSIGRLVALGRVGSGLLEDLTWSTIPYIACSGKGWMRARRPVSGQKGATDDPSLYRTSASTGKFIRLENYTNIRSEGGVQS
ncbi:hypothetical protein BDV95DRAFT_590111 [Massariosphaeria phaeospora]|uniref:Rhodopsin domain-containing protein n=1 Tax=Massariosphaeria phaeospora TaxID=100035 RepID=A0A7C8MK21_9PLEO|nr:hypothetical protein BDV95DRAFT_590111 [Massariosphaeria phaeospora]